jgi:hypothetical protein
MNVTPPVSASVAIRMASVMPPQQQISGCTISIARA